jgi:predicted transcriptional regulator
MNPYEILKAKNFLEIRMCTASQNYTFNGKKKISGKAKKVNLSHYRPEQAVRVAGG